MKYEASSLWHLPLRDMKKVLEFCIGEALEQRFTGNDIIIQFRADDIGAPGKNFFRLMDIFLKHKTPLSLAVVPSWLMKPRWESFQSYNLKAPSLWCWHQHGWRHTNHEPDGKKKQEFGPARTVYAVINDIENGWKRLESIMGNTFYPVFTPPWNRCSIDTLTMLNQMAYNAVSRIEGAFPRAPGKLPDYHINMDLHTRKETNPAKGWENLFEELKGGLSNGYCGIMIHHQRMNDLAFDFIELLLEEIQKHNNIKMRNFRDCVETGL